MLDNKPSPKSRIHERSLIELVHQAIDLPRNEQKAFLALVSGDNDKLLDDALKILDLADSVTDFLDSPAEESLSLLSIDSPPQSLPASNIGPYKLLRAIGSGGMGNVYQAREIGDGYERDVAIKIVKRGMDTVAVLSRFRLERQILASLNHPAIARLIDAGTTSDGLAYFVMEYVDGVPITRYADDNRLSVDDRLALFMNVCQVVHYAHQNLVIHRDIKPSNILVTPDGQIKLLDFGIAKLLNSDNDGFTIPFTSADVQFLTPEYASPEHIRRESISTASDVYSLGVLLYELMTGRRPFSVSSRSYPEVVLAVCETEPTRPSAAIATREKEKSASSLRQQDESSVAELRATTQAGLARVLDGDLDTIVLKALRKEPESRYASAEQLREDVDRFRSNLPIAARPTSTGYRIKKLIARNKTVVWGASTAIAALVALTTIWVITLAHQRNQAQLAMEQAQNVRDFMVNVLNQGAIGEQTDDRLTSAALTLVRPAAKELDDIVGDDNATKVAILNTLAGLLAMNGDVVTADSMLNRAQFLSNTKGVAVQDKLETQFQLGVTMFHRADYDSARVHLERAYEGLNNLYGEDDERTLRALKWYTWSHPSPPHGDLYESTLAKFEKKYGKNSIEVAGLLSDIGQGHKLEWLERAQELYLENGADAAAAGVMASISVGIEGTDPERSLELAERAADILTNALGPDHIHTLTATANLAAMYYDRQMYTIADSMLAEVSRRREALMPGSSKSAAAQLYYHGLTKLALEQFPEAEQFFRDAHLTLHEEHARYSDIVQYLAIAVGKQKRIKEAMQILVDERDRLNNVPGDHEVDFEAIELLLTKLRESGKK